MLKLAASGVEHIEMLVLLFLVLEKNLIYSSYIATNLEERLNIWQRSPFPHPSWIVQSKCGVIMSEKG